MASFPTRMVGLILLAACLTASKGATVHACEPQDERTRMSTFMGTVLGEAGGRQAFSGWLLG